MSTEETVEANAAAEERLYAGMTRRDVCIGAGAAIALLAIGGVKYLGQQPGVRPPGGQDEDRLLAACIRCGKCMEVCPHNIIKPQHMEDGVFGTRTPYLCFDEGWCDWCAEKNNGVPKCAEVCAANALLLPEDAKVKTTILGKAVLKTDWCLAYKRQLECRRCYGACPYEAIILDAYDRPVVDSDLCNGCGACEAACISLESGSISANMDTRAIVVVSAKEA